MMMTMMKLPILVCAEKLENLFSLPHHTKLMSKVDTWCVHHK